MIPIHHDGARPAGTTMPRLALGGVTYWSRESFDAVPGKGRDGARRTCVNAAARGCDPRIPERTGGRVESQLSPLLICMAWRATMEPRVVAAAAPDMYLVAVSNANDLAAPPL